MGVRTAARSLARFQGDERSCRLMPISTDAAGAARIAPWKIIALWTVPAILSTTETVLFSGRAGQPIAVWRAFVGEAPQWYGWAILMLPIATLAARYPLLRPVRAAAIGVHAVASIIAGLALALADALVNAWVRPSPAPLVSSVRDWFIGGLPATTFVYFAIVVATYARKNTAELRRREREALVLEAQLREAQLDALRMQLQPHFLFNSLNAIMALVRDHDTSRAIHALSLLSDVLRATVNAGDAHETTLAAEVDFVTRYLGIEQVRFDERLRVRIDIADDLRDAKVPVFILQPFVENSLKHGVLQGRGANEIAISSHADATMLTLEVRDDGRGLSGAGTNGAGVGISNARRRLERMYGPRAALEVANAASSAGVVVRIRIPLNRSA
jgi:two-component system, LytTR family, sensor kinase